MYVRKTELLAIKPQHSASECSTASDQNAFRSDCKTTFIAGRISKEQRRYNMFFFFSRAPRSHFDNISLALLSFIVSPSKCLLNDFFFVQSSVRFNIWENHSRLWRNKSRFAVFFSSLTLTLRHIQKIRYLASYEYKLWSLKGSKHTHTNVSECQESVLASLSWKTITFNKVT